MKINWDEQKQIEREISWVTAVESTLNMQGAHVKKYSGLTLEDVFDEIYDDNMEDDFFTCKERNPYLSFDKDGDVVLDVTDSEMLEILTTLGYLVYLTDKETDISFNVNDCRTDWATGLFYVDNFRDCEKYELEEYLEDMEEEKQAYIEEINR